MTMLSNKSKAERTAAQAWDYLSAAMAAAGESAVQAGKQTADIASDLAGRAGDKSQELAGKASKRSNKLAAKASKKSNKLTGQASKKSNQLAGKADEAWSRANLAAAALSGRKQGKPWGLIIGVALVGVAVGWAAASSARAALERQAQEEELELAETAVVITPATEV